jgi:Tol biopolymer transport system component
VNLGRRLRSDGRAGMPDLVAVIPGGIAPLVALVGLVIVASFSLAAFNGTLLTKAGGSNGTGVSRTPTPSNVVVVDPRSDVKGTLVYAKSGNVWVQTGTEARQITTGGHDAMPTWSPDGQWIYFIRSLPKIGKWPVNGAPRPYQLAVPYLERVHPDGSGGTVLTSGAFTRGSYDWTYFIREPSLSPDGKTAAVISDGPDPTRSDLLLKFINLSTGAITNPHLSDLEGLGHQDPAWSPDGRSVLYVRNARTGTSGAPVILRYDIRAKATTALTGPGYIAPAWSPDGRYVAATKTDNFGTDIVILDARTGAELLRLTNDENSFDPVWSPAGDAIAFFRVDRGVVDLELATLKGTAPQWTLGATLALTEAAGLDASSHPDWFIPADQLPSPAPSATPTTPPGSTGP